jgi:hypothetical protein
MVSNVSSSALPVPTKTDTLERMDARTVKLADEGLSRLLKNSALKESLAQQSSRWLPPSKNKVIGTLWGMFQKGRSAFINKELVRRAIQEVGGGTVVADAVWKKLSPEGKSIINAGDFALNDYLGEAVGANLKNIQKDVETARVQSARTSTSSRSILDYFV